MSNEIVTVPKMKYRLGLDLGTTSIGWAMIRLNANNEPCAVIRVGVRIFSDGRVPKTGQSLAVERRLARQQRRTRDRKLRRKYKLINLLVQYGFFPEEINERRKLERLDPYQLRVKGLDEPVAETPHGGVLAGREVAGGVVDRTAGGTRNANHELAVGNGLEV